MKKVTIEELRINEDKDVKVTDRFNPIYQSRLSETSHQNKTQKIKYNKKVFTVGLIDCRKHEFIYISINGVLYSYDLRNLNPFENAFDEEGWVTDYAVRKLAIMEIKKAESLLK